MKIVEITCWTKTNPEGGYTYGMLTFKCGHKVFKCIVTHETIIDPAFVTDIVDNLKRLIIESINKVTE